MRNPFENINWLELKNQKQDLLTVIENLEKEALECDKSDSQEIVDNYLNQVNSLQGILSLIDNIQDYAVDTLKKDENEVFNLSNK